MPAEALLYVLSIALAMGGTLFWVSRSKPGDGGRLVAYTSPFALAIMVWDYSLKTRYPHLDVLSAISLGLGAAYLAGFYWIDRRLRIHEGLFFPAAGMLTFQETAASGRGCDDALMRLGRANRCLIVSVTESEVWVRPPVWMMPIARLGGILHRAPLKKVHQMERLTGRSANVRFEYGDDDGWCRCVELKLRNPSAFIEAVREGQFEALD